ncbi:NAD-dependent epimerase/dehydratase family protein [bacterium]|nr:MAG: NAD-dependent epimerase/dehydratase family protein [bacterium]
MAKTYIVLGATGHVGSTVMRALLAEGEKVIEVTRDEGKRKDLEASGAEVAVVDVHETEALREVFRRGQRLFLLNPLAPPSTDTDTEERKSLKSILAAVDGSGLERIVAQSTYGAQPGDHLGDLGVLYEMEQALSAGSIPTAFVRGAYFMSNWDMALESARTEGKVPTLYPPDFTLPMVAPEDLGRNAARLLSADSAKTGVHHVEGPDRYSSADVAAAFAKALGKPVEAVTTPPDEWVSSLKAQGFSDPAAESMANVTRITLEQGTDKPDDAIRGDVTLEEYISQLVSE